MNRPVFLKRYSLEWAQAWSAFSGIDYRCPDTQTGESWQYMGTVGAHHQFRLRHHPRTQSRLDVNVGMQQSISDYPNDYER